MKNSKQLQKIFYDKAFETETVWSESNISDSTRYFIQRFINCAIQPGSKKVLEIGCGNGLLTFFLLKKQLQITSIDISEKAVENMHKQFSGEIHQGRLKLKCADILEFLEGADEKYDVIIGSGIIHHIEKKEWKNLFQLAHKSLAPDGVFACGPEPNAGGLYTLAWPFAKFFYRLFGMDYRWEVEKGTFAMVPKNLKSALRKSGFQNTQILPFQIIPHFHIKLLEYIDRKLIRYAKGKLSFYIVVRGEKVKNN
jgi:2-polyprenyl-3-methyl-5-hydroxy-6-metoxy-1,4-benzoquinol methylase